MFFNCVMCGWVYWFVKNEGGMFGFGFIYNIYEFGVIFFVNVFFVVLEEDKLLMLLLVIGEGYCDKLFMVCFIINISGMSFGVILKLVVLVLLCGVVEVGCWMDIGEGGLSLFYFEGGCDIIM